MRPQGQRAGYCNGGLTVLKPPEVRGRPRTACRSRPPFRACTAVLCGPGGPRTAHAPSPRRYADVLVRIRGTYTVPCGPGGPRTARARIPGGTRTSSSAFRATYTVQCGPGGPRTAQTPNPGRYADVLVRIPGLYDGPMRAGRPAYQCVKRGSACRGPPAFRGRGSRSGTCPAVGPPLSILATTVPGSTDSPSLKSGATLRP